MSIFDARKIDCHCHVLDPAAFPYASDVSYRPSGQETGSADYFRQVLESYGVQHALLVGPNSGYGTDNRCLLDAIRRAPGVFKGIAVLPDDAPRSQLQDLQGQGVLGVAFNPSLHGLDYYRSIGPLLRRLADCGMFAQVQVDAPQMAALAPMLRDSGARVLVDHCGRPNPALGLDEPGFQAVLALGADGLATVKLSGFAKFSARAFPFDDVTPYVEALLAAYGADNCVWASDWPYLKAPQRLDYGALLKLFERVVPQPAGRDKILWQTPRRLFGF